MWDKVQVSFKWSAKSDRNFRRWLKGRDHVMGPVLTNAIKIKAQGLLVNFNKLTLQKKTSWKKQ